MAITSMPNQHAVRRARSQNKQPKPWNAFVACPATLYFLLASFEPPTRFRHYSGSANAQSLLVTNNEVIEWYCAALDSLDVADRVNPEAARVTAIAGEPDHPA